MKYLPVLLLGIFLVAGCVQNTAVPNNNSTIISTNYGGVVKGDNVSVDYIGSFENGTIFDASFGRGPLNFTVGAGQMITGFDNAVIGMKVGDMKNVTLAPKDAYGDYDPNKMIAVPAANVPAGVKVGDTLYSGTQSVRVANITNTTVTIDLNHPLAGKTLLFNIKLLKIN